MIIRQLNQDHLYRLDKVYSTKKLQQIIEEEGLKVTEIKVDSLKWMLKFDMPNFAMTAKSNVERPIVVTLDKGQIRIIDGYHRFIKAVETDVSTLQGYLVTAAHLEKAQVTMEELQRNMYEPDPFEEMMRQRAMEQQAKLAPQLQVDTDTTQA